MSREIIPITSEEQWLELRKKDITATMSPALFNMSPYMTVFELYHAHVSGVQVPFETNERIEKGRRMEAYAANEVGLKLGMKVEPINDYIRIPELNMASSFDWKIFCPKRGWGALEIKAVDYFQFKKKWETESSTDEETGEVFDPEAPPHIEIQLQQQLEVADTYSWGMIVPFYGIYDFQIYERERDHQFGQDIRTAVAKYWDDVKAKREPNPNFYRDSKVIQELFKAAGGEPINLTEDAEFDALVSKFERLKAEKNSAEKEQKAVKAEIHYKLAEAGGAFTKSYKLNTNWTKDSPGTLITQDMVGTVTGGRRGHRHCLVTSLTKKKGVL